MMKRIGMTTAASKEWGGTIGKLSHPEAIRRNDSARS